VEAAVSYPLPLDLASVGHLAWLDETSLGPAGMHRLIDHDTAAMRRTSQELRDLRIKVKDQQTYIRLLEEQLGPTLVTKTGGGEQGALL